MSESWKTFTISIAGVLIGGSITFGTSYYILQGEAQLERERLSSQEKNIIYQTNHQSKVENYAAFSFSYDKLMSENNRLLSILMDLGNRQMQVGDLLQSGQLKTAQKSYESLCYLTQKKKSSMDSISKNIVKEHEKLHKSFYILLTYIKDKETRKKFQERYQDIWQYLTLMGNSMNFTLNELNFFINHYSTDIETLQTDYQKRIKTPEFKESLDNKDKVAIASTKFEKSSENLKDDLYNELFK